ncbi:MAG: hypothetical protein FJZ43_03635 [Candidatus Staskawiczbacteria bacterium]|nr:hypothetical protein [Candidatus Staskawiczbacteria bacterium]
MTFDYHNILHYFSEGYGVVPFLFFAGSIVILAIVFFAAVGIIGRKLRPYLLWSLLRTRAYSIITAGFIFHLANVFIFLRYDFFEKYKYYSLGIITVWLFTVYAFYELNKIVKLLKQSPYAIAGISSSRSLHFKNATAIINKAKSIYLLWFLFFIPYLLLFLNPYFTPNYALVFDNSGSMQQSVEDAKSFVKKEFSDALSSNTEFIITKIPRNEKFDIILNEFQTRLTRENAQTGSIQISLKWDNLNDLDLHCIEPNNNKIFFGNKLSQTGGNLDVDMNAGGKTSSKPIENIYFGFGKGLPGKYKIIVNFFAKKTPVSNNRFDVLLSVNNSLHLLTGTVGTEKADATVFEFNYNPNKIPTVKDFTLGPNIKINSLNSIKSITEIVSTNSNDLRAQTFRVNSKEAFSDSINNLQPDGFGSPISQLIKQNYAECLEYFGQNSNNNRCVIITDGEDESLINDVYTGENFILEYENLTGKETMKPIDYFSNIDFVIYEGASSGYINTKLHELAAKNKNVKVHIINSSESSSNKIFQNIFKNIIIEWEYLYMSLLPILLFGLMLQVKLK